MKLESLFILVSFYLANAEHLRKTANAGLETLADYQQDALDPSLYTSFHDTKVLSVPFRRDRRLIWLLDESCRRRVGQPSFLDRAWIQLARGRVSQDGIR